MLCVYYIDPCLSNTPCKVSIDSRNGLAPNDQKPFLESMMTKTWTCSKMLGSLVTNASFCYCRIWWSPVTFGAFCQQDSLCTHDTHIRQPKIFQALYMFLHVYSYKWSQRAEGRSSPDITLSVWYIGIESYLWNNNLIRAMAMYTSRLSVSPAVRCFVFKLALHQYFKLSVIDQLTPRFSLVLMHWPQN